MTTAVEVRCPLGTRKLFCILLLEEVPEITSLLEVACYDCRKKEQRAGKKVSLVLHRYNLEGVLVQTRMVQ